MGHTHKIEAIILKKKHLLQKDMIITLLSNEQGKITAIAKGIKKITSRRSPHIQTGNLINVIFSQKGSMYYVQETELVSGFSSIKEHPMKLDYLYSFLFILDRILPEGQQETQVYNLTKSFFIELAKNEAFNSSNFRLYLQKLLMLLGYIQKDLPLADLIHETEEIINEKVPLHAIM